MSSLAVKAQPLGLFPDRPQPRLYDRVVETLRVHHYSFRTERAYVQWIRRFLEFHGKRHPRDLHEDDVNRFLTSLAVRDNVAASTQNQALAAVLFLYEKVLELPLDRIEGVVRARRPRRLPVVLTRDEVGRVMAELQGTYQTIGLLLYGAGLRMLECLRLRVKDVDFDRRELSVREGKGDKDRRTMLPEAAVASLQSQLAAVRRLHEQDLGRGFGTVELPHALERKFAGAASEFRWQYVFPATTISKDPRSDARRRHHLHESAVSRAITAAVRRGYHETGDGPHLPPQLRHPPDRSRLRHPDRAGTAGPQGRSDHDDLHARSEQRRPRRPKPGRFPHAVAR